MADVFRLAQYSFTGGVITPLMYGRYNTERYSGALSAAENWTVLPQGGITFRRGTKFVGKCKNGTRKGRLLPFSFNAAQSYCLDFDNGTMRVVKDGGYVAAGASPYELPVPYLEPDLPLLKYTQSNDIMTTCQPAHLPRNISRTAHNNWAISSITFTNNPFASTGNPQCVTYYQQRKFYGAPTLKPQKLDATRIGGFSPTTDDFSVTSPTIQDDDALNRSLTATTAHELRHLVPRDVLLGFTSDGAWRLGSNGDEAVTPNSFPTKLQQSEVGCSHVPPVPVGENIFFATATNNEIYSLGYNYESDGFKPNDISSIVEHYFQGNTIVAMAYARRPNSLFYIVLSDGSFLTLTWKPILDTMAFTRNTLGGGFVEDVISITEGTENAVYFRVKRTINGETVRYIERLETGYQPLIKDAWHLDCARRYDGAPTKIIGGNDHLEGETVTAFADGSVYPNLVVTSGQVILPVEVSTAIIGKPYLGYFETLPMDIEGTQGLTRTVREVFLRIYRTRALKVSTNGLTAYEQKVSWADGDTTAVEPITDDILFTPEASWDLRQKIRVEQNFPVPATVLNIAPIFLASQ